VLKRAYQGTPLCYESYDGSFCLRQWSFDNRWTCEFAIDRCYLKSDHCHTAQSAVSAVEAKLRALVRSINEVLGE
jgi:hypothetical protein